MSVVMAQRAHEVMRWLREDYGVEAHANRVPDTSPITFYGVTVYAADEHLHLLPH